MWKTNALTVTGTITNIDGTPAAGLEVTATIIGVSDNVGTPGLVTPSTSRPDGSYVVALVSLSGVPIARNGDTVEVQAFTPDGELVTSTTVQLSSEQIMQGTATIDLQVPITEFLLSVPAGTSLIHVPLKVTAVDGVETQINSVGDLYDALGGASSVNLLTTLDPKQGWQSYLGESSRGTSADPALTDDLGIMAAMKVPVSVRLSGNPLGTNGSSTITLNQGDTLVGLPLNDPRITRVSDLFGLEGIRDNVSSIIVSDNGKFKVVKQAGDDGDNPGYRGAIFCFDRAAGGDGCYIR